MKNELDSYSKWMNRRPQGEVTHIPEATLRDYLEKDHYEQLSQLIQDDLNLGNKLSLRNKLIELIILQQHFLNFCNNFVNFKYFYLENKRAAFECGTLILDGKIFEFTLAVDDIKRHSQIAESSGMFCLYLKLHNPYENNPQFICAPVCALRNKITTLGKRGILVDLAGRQVDAEIIKIIDTPVSLIDSLFNPFRKISLLIINAIEKISENSEKNLEKQVSSGTKQVQTELHTQKQDKAKQSTTSRDLMFTFAALGSSLTYILAKLSSFNLGDVINGLFNALMIILIPTFIISLIKLSRRNFNSIIEASGFAINYPMHLTRQLSKSLTAKKNISEKHFEYQKISIDLNRKL